MNSAPEKSAQMQLKSGGAVHLERVYPYSWKPVSAKVASFFSLQALILGLSVLK